MTRPKPRQAGHAPMGLLKLNNPGVGGFNSVPVSGEVQPREKESRFPDSGSTTLTTPLPRSKARSRASASRISMPF